MYSCICLQLKPMRLSRSHYSDKFSGQCFLKFWVGLVQFWVGLVQLFGRASENEGLQGSTLRLAP